MGEIIFLFGALFGVAIGRMFNKIDQVRMAHLDSELIRTQRRMRQYRRLYHECRRSHD